MKQVFLSGPMRGIDRSLGLEWRSEASLLLKDNFITRHAYRGREKEETFPDFRLAVIRDKQDVLNSDVLLVNDTLANVSMIGTSMEILLAFESHIPVIIFGNAHLNDYFMNFHSQVRCNSLKDACKLLNEMFSE